MIVNSYSIAYLVCSFFSLGIGLAAAVNGFHVFRRWDVARPVEEQYRLEQRIYLIITIVSLGLFLRLLMTPLWFMTLHSMILSLPGAMCLAGVHDVNPALSYPASGLKLLLPPLYVFWLLLNFLDRQTPAQPFLKQKLLFLTPLGILLLGETILDASFFLVLPSHQVTCCTSLFNVPGAHLPPPAVQSWSRLMAFYTLAILILGEIIYFFLAQRRSASSLQGWWFGNKGVMILETTAIIATFSLFIQALHAEASPLFLHQPSHHCIFCLGQEVWDALLSFGMIFLGLTLFMIYFWVVSFARYRDFNPNASEKMVRLLGWSGAMLTGGLIIFSVHLLFVIPQW